MKKKKSQSKPKRIIPPLIDELYDGMVLMNFNKNLSLNADRLGDNSCRYLTIVKDGYELSIEFDPTGEQVTDIQLFKQVIQVVDHTKVWGT